MIKLYEIGISAVLCFCAFLSGCESKPVSLAKVPGEAVYSQPELEDELVVKVRASNTPPLNYCSEEGIWTGVDVELVRAVVTRAGFTPRFIELPWARALLEMERGNVDIMMDLSKTPGRSEYMHWIGPVRYSTMALVVNKNNQNLPVFSIDDLAKVAEHQKGRFGIQKNVFYSKAFTKRLEDPRFAGYFESCSNAESNLRKLIGGRILGFFEEKYLIEYHLERSLLTENIAMHPFSLAKNPLYFGISKKSVSPGIYQRLKAAFLELEKEGTLNKILQRQW